ncbi:hypothetical protein IEQ34_022759 [Dendrobium chrysotoxum]|uniref:Uncharacterized protein n=1 Tax=Dendrobium chrysotoxum TaxID=161865 RepID=A0AAV7FYN4_DENCH|nr:hypothetical protein IEQ34_022759 [Dendrobium chrysotoxum]
MENLCKLHGWGIRDTPRRVFDAVLFSNEVDILEIRWNELHPFLSDFVLLESNSTFIGQVVPFIIKAAHSTKLAQNHLQTAVFIPKSSANQAQQQPITPPILFHFISHPNQHTQSPHFLTSALTIFQPAFKQ